MTDKLLRIVAIGPESTGKSTLCQGLAQYYQAAWCPEYAREYLLQHGKNYTFENLLEIAQGQLALEEQLAKEAVQQWSVQVKPNTQRPILFIDTDLNVMKVWCEFVFGDCHPWILERIAERHYDLYFLCHTDLPWTADELREYPDLDTRQTLWHIYQDALLHQAIPWTDVKGVYADRMAAAIQAVDALLGKTES
ncbi:MAG: ATP-binding protein [Bacteroidetes bacterium]|nr:ATP-binding protein [Bacteroidota bacterium]